MKEIAKINRLLKEMKGKPMTKEQLAFQEVLRKQVKEGRLTVYDAHQIWYKKYERNKP